jgi:dTDP-D-glucose 4,6-dehydratase
LHTEDTVDALLTIIEKGERNRIYNVGSNTELRNIEVLRAIAKLVGVPEDKAWISIEDRSGQDIRYSLDDRSLRALGWAPRRSFPDELPAIVNGMDVSRFS